MTALAILEQQIFMIRGQKVLLDSPLAELYGVETRVLLQAVKRNIDRFPEDFMFVLTKQAFNNLRSQIVTSSWGGRRTPPYAFTEQGGAMLSSVLRSKQFKVVFNAIRELMKPEESSKRPIGFLWNKEEKESSNL